MTTDGDLSVISTRMMLHSGPALSQTCAGGKQHVALEDGAGDQVRNAQTLTPVA